MDRSCSHTQFRGNVVAPFAILRKALPGVIRSVQPDQAITIEGAPRETVIGVASGLLRCFRVTPDGRRHIGRFVRAGDLVGLGVHPHYRNSTEAVTTGTIVEFPARSLDFSNDLGVDVRHAVLRAMSAEIAAQDRAQFRVGRLWADERVADFLMELSEGVVDDACAPHDIIMSRADIADHLGVTIETVSRALHRFQRLGLVRLTGARRFAIVRRRDLKGFASGDQDTYAQAVSSGPAGGRCRVLCAA